MNCERHTFLSQYNNAAISSHVFAHSIHFQLCFIFCHSLYLFGGETFGGRSFGGAKPWNHFGGANSFPRTPHLNMFSYFKPFVFHEHFSRSLQFAAKSCFQILTGDDSIILTSNFACTTMVATSLRHFRANIYMSLHPGRDFLSSHLWPMFFALAFVHSLHLKRWWHFLFPSEHFDIPRLSQYYSWEFNSFFQQDIVFVLQPMKLFYISVPILRHGNLSAQRIQFYRASLRQCNSLHSLWDCGPHSQISYATRPYYSARALYQCYGWSFIHFTNVLRGIVMGLSSRTSALSTQLSTLEMFVYRQFIFIVSQILTYICGPYQILTILFKL